MKIKLSRLSLVAAAAVCIGGPASAEERPLKTGKQVYETLCQACHMPGGVGDPATYPALARNPKLQEAGYPTYVVLNGLKAMPAFGSVFKDEEIAGVVNYIRTNFGNKYKKPTTAAEVKALRP